MSRAYNRREKYRGGGEYLFGIGLVFLYSLIFGELAHEILFYLLI